MDRNTLLAIILSVIVITVGFSIQAVFFPPEVPVVTENTTETINTTQESTNQSLATPKSSGLSSLAYNSGRAGSVVAIDESSNNSRFSFDTNVFSIVFDPKGASIASMKLKNHLDEGTPVDMIFRSENDPKAFNLYFGKDWSNPIDATFSYSKLSDTKIAFSQNFGIVGDDGSIKETFKIVKTYTFSPDDYLFELTIEIVNSTNEAVPLNFEGYAYTLGVEPQIGPVFDEAPDGRYKYRRFYTLQNGKRSNEKLKDGNLEIDTLFSWASITGKYFTAIGIPDETRYTLNLVEGSSEALALTSNMYYSRPVIRSSSNVDTFRFYMGPQLKQHLALYNDAEDNGFGLQDLQLEKALDTSSWLGFLENFLKWLLNVFYSVIPNYGVAIILLTLLIKVVLYPFTKKSYDSTAKMQALGPQLEELKKKYKDNPTKLNQETAELYKKEGVNPMGGCLPMLLQFPIFIALYGLLNKHFELRGAVFIPGWISDLSAPESIFNFSPVSIPFVGSDIRLLPILYVASMIFSMKISQSGAASTANSQTASMNKMMTYFMPIMFFFILYNAPSGLLLYWSVMNIFTIIQQQATNVIKKKQMDAVNEHPELKIVKKTQRVDTKKRK